MNPRRPLFLLTLTTVLLVSATGLLASSAYADAATPAAAGRGVSPDLDPGTVGLCNTGFGDVSVSHATAVRLGRVDLRCGNTSTGYVHVRSVWEKSWQKAISGAPGQHLWDDFAVFAISRALSHPSHGYPHTSASTWCYATTIRVTTASGTIIRVLNPTVLVSATTRNVITAAPTARPDCSIR